MAGAGPTLREIHRLRKHGKNLQDEMNRLPILQKAQQGKVARHEELLKEAQDQLKHVKVTVLEKEGLLKSTHAQIGKHQKQLNAVGSKKEYDALQAEIATDKATCARLEDEILEGMGDIEERSAKIPELEKALKQARDEAAAFEKGMAGRLAALKEQKTQAQQELADVEKNVPADIRPQLDRILLIKGEDALALVRNQTCTACYTGITSQNQNDLIAGSFVICKACGRVLYLGDE